MPAQWINHARQYCVVLSTQWAGLEVFKQSIAWLNVKRHRFPSNYQEKTSEWIYYILNDISANSAYLINQQTNTGMKKMARGIYFDIFVLSNTRYSLISSAPNIWTHELPLLSPNLMLSRGMLASYEVSEQRLVLREVSLNVPIASIDSFTLFGVPHESAVIFGSDVTLTFKFAHDMNYTGLLELGHENFDGPDQATLLRLHFVDGQLLRAEQVPAIETLTIAAQPNVVPLDHSLGFRRDAEPDPQVYRNFCLSLQADLDSLAAEIYPEKRAHRTFDLIDRIEGGHTWQISHIRRAIKLWVKQLDDTQNQNAWRALDLLAMVGHQITSISDYQPLIDWLETSNDPNARAGGITILRHADSELFAKTIARLGRSVDLARTLPNMKRQYDS